MNIGDFDLVIFDFDGVVVDSEGITNRHLAEALTALGHPTTLDESLRWYMGRRWADCAVAIEARIGRALPEGFNVKRRAAVDAELATALQAIPGIGGFVDALGGKPHCIASSSVRKTIQHGLEIVGLSDRFSSVYSAAEDVEHGKPAPDIFLFAANAMRADPARTLVIEDSAAGITGAKAAGMTAIGLLAGSHIRDGHGGRLTAAGADAVVAGYAELAELLGLRPR